MPWLPWLALEVPRGAMLFERLRLARLVDPRADIAEWDHQRFLELRERSVGDAIDWVARCHRRDPANVAVAAARADLLLRVHLPWRAAQVGDGTIGAVMHHLRIRRTSRTFLRIALRTCVEVGATESARRVLRMAPSAGLTLPPADERAPDPPDPRDPREALVRWLATEVDGDRFLSHCLIGRARRVDHVWAWSAEAGMVGGADPALVGRVVAAMWFARPELSAESGAVRILRAVHEVVSLAAATPLEAAARVAALARAAGASRRTAS